MLISDAAKRAGLTKKAIRYYEQEGLIAPRVIGDNQYRDYTEEDVMRLSQIAVLRQIGLGVGDIKQALDHPDRFLTVMEQHLLSIEKEVDRLTCNQQAIKDALKGMQMSGEQILPNVAEQIEIVKVNIEEISKRSPGYLQKQLSILFPGIYGKMIGLRFLPFLQEPVDSHEKEQAWSEIVTYLDETEEMTIPEELQQTLAVLSESDVEKLAESNYQQVLRIANASEEELEMIKEELCTTLEQLQGNEDVRKYRLETWNVAQQVKNQLEETGYYDRVVKNIRILSREYDRYHQVLQKIQSEMDMRYDEHGNIQFKVT